MTRLLLLLALVLLVARVSAAQSCDGHYMQPGATGWSYSHWLPPDAEAAPGIVVSTNAAHVFSPAVPAGKFWILKTVSMSTNYGQWAEFMVEHLVNVPGGYHFHAMARSWASGTPVLAVSSGDLRWDPLMPGERLGFRANIDASSTTIGIFGMWSYFEYPLTEDCLARALGMAAVTSSGAGPPMDFSALMTAAQHAAAAQGVAATANAAAAAALQALAQSAP